jgi:hypothetical protein
MRSIEPRHAAAQPGIFLPRRKDNLAGDAGDRSAIEVVVEHAFAGHRDIADTASPPA